MLSTIIATILTDQVKWTLDIIQEQEHGAVLENGIIFNHVTKFLLAEKFINVDFLVPFPKFELDLRAELGAYIEKHGKLWVSPSWQCHLDYSTNFQKNDSAFDVDWLLHQVEDEVTLAEQELAALRNYTSSFLNYETAAAQDVHHSPRAAPFAMMALASVGIIGSGIALRGESCGIKGIFGSCHDKSKTNAENIQKLADFTEALIEDVFKLRNEANDKFCMVTSELAAIKSVQKKCLKFKTVTGKSLKSTLNCFKIIFTSYEIVISYFSIASRSIPIMTLFLRCLLLLSHL